MQTQLDQLWWRKYRPKSLSEYVFQNEAQRQAIENLVKEKSIPHLLLAGMQGSGKTALAEILIESLGLDPIDVLTINASDENNVDMVRDKIKSFVTTYAMGPFKVIFLDEADYLTQNGQAILRVMMAEYADVARFIIACNHENKILPAIRSRCQRYHFKASNVNDVTELVVQILLKEKVKFDLDLVDKYVSVGYPDIRQILNLLQQHTVDRVLIDPTDTQNGSGDYKFQLIDLLDTDGWKAMREVACANVLPDEWEDIYRFLYENLHKSPKFAKKDKWDAGIIQIAEFLDRHGRSSDPEINAAALFIELEHI